MAAALGAACSGDSPAPDADPKAVEDAIVALAEKYNKKDVQGFLDGYTQAGFDDVFGGLSREIVEEQLAEFIGTVRGRASALGW